MSTSGDHPGFRATVAALAVAQTLAWAALYYGFSSFVPAMKAEMGWSQPTMMGAFTLGLACSGLAAYGAGSLIDRGHGRALMAGGSLMAAAGFSLWAMAWEAWVLYAAWAVMGTAMAATLYEPAFAILTRRYPTRYRDGIMALTLVAGFASTLSFPAAAAMVEAWGWRASLWAIAAMFALVVAPLNAWALRGPMAVAATAEHEAGDDSTLHEALHTPAFWFLTATFTLNNLVSAGFFAHVIPAFAELGVAQGDTLTMLMWIGPAQVVARFVYAWVGRGLTLQRLGLLVVAGTPLSLALLLVDTSLAMLVAFALIYGTSNGLTTIVRGGIVPEFFGRAHIGRIAGVMTAVGLVSRAAAPLALAWSLWVLPGYRGVIALLAVLGLLSAKSFALAVARAPRNASTGVNPGSS